MKDCYRNIILFLIGKLKYNIDNNKDTWYINGIAVNIKEYYLKMRMIEAIDFDNSDWYYIKYIVGEDNIEKLLEFKYECENVDYLTDIFYFINTAKETNIDNLTGEENFKLGLNGNYNIDYVDKLIKENINIGYNKYITKLNKNFTPKNDNERIEVLNHILKKENIGNNNYKKYIKLYRKVIKNTYNIATVTDGLSEDIADDMLDTIVNNIKKLAYIQENIYKLELNKKYINLKSPFIDITIKDVCVSKLLAVHFTELTLDNLDEI